MRLLMFKLLLVVLLGVSGASARLAVVDPNFTWTSSVAQTFNHSIRIDIKTGYFDIEEDVEIKSNMESPAVQEVVGSLNFPPNSSVVGLFLWNGDVILKGKLKSTFKAVGDYEEVVDRSPTPPLLPTDPALLVRKSNDNYELKIYPINAGQSRKIRIRYLVPYNSFNGGNVTPVFVDLWTNSATKISIASSVYDSASVLINTLGKARKLPVSFDGQDVNDLMVKPIEKGGATSLRTEFTSSEYKGHYLWLNENVPNEVWDYAGVKREIVILWKWSNTNLFKESLTMDGFNNYTFAVNAQSYDFLSLIDNESRAFKSRISFGLVHQIEKEEPVVFKMGSYGSEELEQIKGYVTKFTSLDNIWNALPRLEESKPSNEKKMLEDKVIAQKMFRELIDKSVALFSPSDSIIKHIVLVHAGPDLNIYTPGLADIEMIEELKGISVSAPKSGNSNQLNRFYGVNIDSVVKNHEYKGELEQVDIYSSVNFSFPKGQILNYTAELNGEVSNKIYSLNIENAKIKKALHTSERVADSITWLIWDDRNQLIAEKKTKFNAITVPSDSGIAKIVVADLNVVDDVIPSGAIGANFGVVRLDYALVALESDSIGSVATQQYELSGLPYLLEDEIFYSIGDITTGGGSGGNNGGGNASIKAKQDELKKNLFVKRIDGDLYEISVTAKYVKSIGSITIVDIQGKQIASLNALELKQKLTLLYSAKDLSSGLYFVKVQLGSQSVSMPFYVY